MTTNLQEDDVLAPPTAVEDLRRFSGAGMPQAESVIRDPLYSLVV